MKWDIVRGSAEQIEHQFGIWYMPLHPLPKFTTLIVYALTCVVILSYTSLFRHVVVIDVSSMNDIHW
jgi:hypothetical protein